VTSKLTRMAEGVVGFLGARNGGRAGEGLQGSSAGVAETAMPGGRGWSCHKGAGGGGRRRYLQGVEGPRTVTAKKSSPGAEILHRNTERVKLD
jgi:hypothetical protein